MLQETPQAIQAFSSDVLKQIGADDFEDYFLLVPGLTTRDEGPGNKRYALRGIQSPGEPQVGVYYDEIPVAGVTGEDLDIGNTTIDLKMWDVERVEVLKGPQGTLYGQGSMGGTLRIISKRPVLNDFEVIAQTTAASTEDGDTTWRINGVVNIPLVDDKLALRVSGYSRDEGGYIDDIFLGTSDINDERTWGGRASLLFKPTDALTLTAIAYYQDTETGSAFELFPSFAQPGNDRISKVFVQTPFEDKARLYNLIAEYEMDSASLLVTGSYQKRNIFQIDDTTRFVITGIFGCTEFNATPFGGTCFVPPIIPTASTAFQNVSSYAAEARLVSKSEGPLQWTAGAFWQDREMYRRGQVGVVTAANNYMPTYDSTGEMDNRIFARSNTRNSDQSAVFGEVSYDLTEKLTGTVGLRWFTADVSELQELVQPFFGGQTGFQPLQTFSEDKLIKKFHLAYKATDDVLLYLLASEGFRLGGPNQPGGFTVFAPPYNADSLWNYEFGWKSTWADGRVVFNGAIYHIDWSDLQVAVVDQTGAFTSIANGPDAASTGFEAEVILRATDRLDLIAGVSYSDARLVEDHPQANLDPANGLKDDPLPNVSPWTLSASAIYTWNINTSLDGVFRLDGSYRDKQATAFNNAAGNFAETESWYLANARVGVQADSWSVFLFVDNVFDEVSQFGVRIEGNEPLRATSARPRTIGLQLDKRF